MGKIFHIMGKSSTGKDTVYKKLLEREAGRFRTIVMYTTRPRRDGDRRGGFNRDRQGGFNRDRQGGGFNRTGGQGRPQGGFRPNTNTRPAAPAAPKEGGAK